MSEDEKEHVINEINAQIALVSKAFLLIVIPIALAGLGLLVSNHYGQMQLKVQVTEISHSMKLTQDRVYFIWMTGGYAQKYREFENGTK